MPAGQSPTRHDLHTNLKRCTAEERGHSRKGSFDYHSRQTRVDRSLRTLVRNFH